MKARGISIGLAAIAFLALSGVNTVIFRGMYARTNLESRNDGERTVNLLFSSLRNFDDFGEAVENMPSLTQKVIGVAVFDSDAACLYSWGAVPSVSPAEKLIGTAETDRMTDAYFENAKNSSMIILMRPSKEGPQPPPPHKEEDPPERSGESFMSHTLRKADIIYLEIRQPDYWRDKRLRTILFPLVELLLAALVVFVRFLILRNTEYRNHIEQQKNLVMLGTAASTLAHEIKNPLLAIRLQTGILSRTLSGTGDREIAIINEEVDRLSMLSHRVNDILRDPAGNPRIVDPAEIANEVGTRLCGRPFVGTPADSTLRLESNSPAANPPAYSTAHPPADLSADLGPPSAARNSPRVRIDPERLRSILENLLRNALESGGKEEDVAIEITGDTGHVIIDVLDQGAGVPPVDRSRVFDPFFTTKSRGSGIGLAICQRFVAAAGGKISLTDRSGGGSRARVVLPAIWTEEESGEGT